MQLKAKSTETIFDVCINANVPIDSCIELLNNNDLGIDDEVGALTLTIDSSLIEVVVPATIRASELIEENPSKSLVVKNGQSIFDIALMAHGAIDNLFVILQDNNFNSINDYLVPQMVINYNMNDVVNRKNKNVIDVNGWIFNTSDPKIISGESYDDSFDNSYL